MLQEKFWSFIDRDGSGDLNTFEFRNAVTALDHGYMYAVPGCFTRR